MVCPRCIMAVQDILEKKATEGVEILKVDLGIARINAPDTFTATSIQDELQSIGFELLQDPEEQLTENIRINILKFLKLNEEGSLHLTLSGFLTDALHKNYTALSKHFTRQTGQTIENFYIHAKVERVKELLQDSQMNASQIADKLNYSSVHYLSGQFKKVTGVSISEYKNLVKNSRTPLDKI